MFTYAARQSLLQVHCFTRTRLGQIWRRMADDTFNGVSIQECNPIFIQIPLLLLKIRPDCSTKAMFRFATGRRLGCLTHWGWVTHICVSKLTIIGSDNGLSPGRRQAIIWTSDGILLIGPLGTNFSETLSKILTFSLKKMRFKVSSAKWWPFCLGLNVLTHWPMGRHMVLWWPDCTYYVGRIVSPTYTS